jgi:hypothetical protein
VSALKRVQLPSARAELEAEVHHANLEPRPHDANGAHNLAAHRVLLLAEYVLDTGAHLQSVVFADFWRSDSG